MKVPPLMCNTIAAAAQYPGYRRFVRALRDVEGAQRTVLRQLLTVSAETEFGRAHGMGLGWSYEDVASRLPITCYEDWADSVDRQRRRNGAAVLSRDCARYEPTSGSTAKRKWIPYTRRLLDEFDAAAAPWLFDLARQYRAMLGGRHYWSLSWLPDDLRGEDGANTTDDIELFPWWKRWVMQGTMAVPPDVALCATLEDSLFRTLVHLAECRNLTLLSVWSPTFLLELLRLLSERKEEVVAALDKRGAPAAVLSAWDGSLSADLAKGLWPRLQLVSAWDTSSSAQYAARVKALFPHASFQGKGLWATEGVVTFPFKGRYPLAITSHFYEFRVLSAPDVEIVPAWRLKPGMHVQPVITTGSGFWRYVLDDRLEVVDFLENCPCLVFRGRLNGIDMVGEKVDAVLAEEVLAGLSSATESNCVSLMADPGDGGDGRRPRYLVLVEGAPGSEAAIGAEAEERLAELHHYRLAREMGQLDAASAVATADAFAYYVQNGATTGLLGGRKMEPLFKLGPTSKTDN